MNKKKAWIFGGVSCGRAGLHGNRFYLMGQEVEYYDTLVWATGLVLRPAQRSICCGSIAVPVRKIVRPMRSGSCSKGSILRMNANRAFVSWQFTVPFRSLCQAGF